MMKTRSIILSSFCFAAWSSSLLAQGIQLYVAPQGQVHAAGSPEAPLPSISAAQEVLHSQYQREPFSEATIWLAEGYYQMDEQINFSPALFDGHQVKITIKSSSPNKAVLTGGIRIPSHLFTPISHAEHGANLAPEVAGKLYVAALNGTSYAANFSQNPDDGSATYKQKLNYSTLAFDDEIIHVAAWPNRGYAHFKTILYEGPKTRHLRDDEQPEPYSLEQPTGARFTMDEQSNWIQWKQEFDRTRDVLLEGYPQNDWYFQRERLGKIEGDVIQLLRYTRYGVKETGWMIPRRVKFVNLLCELDEPGEWYFDHQSKQLYIYPITPIEEKTEIRLLGQTQMFQIEGMDGFRLENVILRNGGRLGIGMKNCNNSLIAGCDFQNFMGRGINIEGGANNGIVSNNFKGLDAVASINGGDVATLTPCHHYMSNNMIHDCRMKGYGLVGLRGVGIRFNNNLMFNLNGALNYSGCEMMIEQNEFYNMGTEMNDWNVIYTGANWCDWGNVIRHNFAHHLMGMPSSAPIEAFRNDDMGMGSSYIGNVFYKAGKACINFSGAGNDCIGNIALKTYSVWRAHFGIVGEASTRKRWNAMLNDYDSGLKQRGDKDDMIWKTEKVIGKFGWKFTPFITKYPRFNQIMNEGSPWRNSFCIVKNNYLDEISEKNTGYTCYKAKPELMLEGSDWNYPSKINMQEAFINPNELNFAFKSDFSPIEGFEAIPFDSIGLYVDEYRDQCPDKSTYRKEVKERYKGVSASGRKYNKKTANSFYDLPSYLK